MSITPIQLQQYRQDTPSCEHVIHFNNAGAALSPLPVTEAVRTHLRLEEQLGGYEAAAIHAEKSQAFYGAVARLLNTQAQNIAYANSATSGYNRALSAIPFVAGDIILTTENDYVSNHIAFLQAEQRFGAKLVVAPEQEQGGVNTAEFLKLIAELQPKLVAVTHMPTSSGLIQALEIIGQACREIEAWYLVDACQTAGQLPLDVEVIGCDFLAATCRKFLRGPRGSGFLYISDRVLTAGLTPLYLDLHSAHWTASRTYQPQADGRRFELWERNHALVHGAVAAINYAQTIGLAAIAERSRELAAELRLRLLDIPNLRVLDQGEHLGAIVTCYHEDLQPDKLLAHLRKKKMHGSINWRDYARYDLDRKEIPWALRLSPHYYNTIEEVDILSKEIFKIIC